MGGEQSQIENNLGLPKGDGYRVINVRPNSPLDQQLTPFFDFIIDVTITKTQNSSQSQLSPRQILDKLTIQTKKNHQYSSQKRLQQLLISCENHEVTLRVLSTKYRSVRNIDFIPNRNWNGKQDLLGFSTRLSKFDVVFDNYYPFANIQNGSPTQRAGINEGKYFIGCKQFEYFSIQQFLQKINEIYFQKQKQKKTITLVVYDIISDELEQYSVQLSRNWGKNNGLLGCQFLEGALYRFPKKLEQKRQMMKKQMEKAKQSKEINKQMKQSYGSGAHLAKKLNLKRENRNKNIKKLKKRICAQALQPYTNDIQEIKDSQKSIRDENGKISFVKYKNLQNRVRYLEQTLASLTAVLNDLREKEQ